MMYRIDITYYFEVDGLCVNEDGSRSPAGIKITIENHRGMPDDSTAEKALGLVQEHLPGKTVRSISPEHYEEEYGDDED